jgi:hypothetical protein
LEHKFGERMHKIAICPMNSQVGRAIGEFSRQIQRLRPQLLKLRGKSSEFALN